MATMVLAVCVAIVGIMVGVAFQPHPLLDANSTLSTMGFSVGTVAAFVAYSLWKS